MSDDKQHSVGEALKRDLEQTKADLARGKQALQRDLVQTKSNLSGGSQGEDLNQNIGHTIRQALGSAPMPLEGEANPTPADSDHPIEFRTPHCPTCDSVLEHEQDVWVCLSGHGRATTVPVAGREVGTAAVQTVWAASETAQATGAACPFCAEPMVVIDLAWDETAPSSLLTPGGPITGTVVVEVCRMDMLIWSGVGELEALASHAAPAA